MCVCHICMYHTQVSKLDRISPLYASTLCRYNKLALDAEAKSSSLMTAERTVDKPKAEATPSQPPKFFIQASTPAQSASLSGEKENSPAILSLLKDPPSMMGSSFILSTLHTKKMGTKGSSESNPPAPSLSTGGEMFRPERQTREGVVDETLKFQASRFLGLNRIVSVSSGTNHTVFLTGVYQVL